MIVWQCIRCGLDLDSNPRVCPKCGYTVYRPVRTLDSAPLVDRRQCAREAAYDSEPNDQTMHYDGGSMEMAIETATRVKITEDIVDAFKRFAHPAPLEPNIRPALSAAFEAAGFEVEE